MNLKDAMRVERSLRMRAGSLADLANGRMQRSRKFNIPDIDLSDTLLEVRLSRTAELMADTVYELNSAIETAMAKISIDI